MVGLDMIFPNGSKNVVVCDIIKHFICIDRVRMYGIYKFSIS